MDFIVTAFKTARAHVPDALLIYNDYNEHKPGKREKLIELLTELKAAGAPIDAYGMLGEGSQSRSNRFDQKATARQRLGLFVGQSNCSATLVHCGCRNSRYSLRAYRNVSVTAVSRCD